MCRPFFSPLARGYRRRLPPPPRQRPTTRAKYSNTTWARVRFACRSFSQLRTRLLLLFEEGKILGVAFFLQFFHGNESERGRVDAIALTGWRRAIRENVAKVRVAL